MKNGILIDKQFIAENLTFEAPWCGSHGADGDYLGGGLLYYALVYSLRASVAVCLGSGGGFVPRLMRQAQLDLGLAETSRTVLVDGNCPEAGWGAPAWLDLNSFFRREFGDIELVLQRTDEAARAYFSRTGLMIDYLHIDADHSFRGCLNDFVAYRPFLREGSVITFHDTKLEGAGVGAVVEHVRRLEDCELVNFENLGAGLAVARIISNSRMLQACGWSAGEPPKTAAVTIRRHGDAPALEPNRMGWNYLGSEAFATRHVLAAWQTRNCGTVIEIGGGRNTIDGFLGGPHDSIVVIDPFLRDRSWSEPARGLASIAHLRARFQDVDFEIIQPGGYWLILLGLELQEMEPRHWQILCNLINQAAVTVIEFPTSWHTSGEQFCRLRDGTRTRQSLQFKLDLEGNHFGDATNSWPPRCDREMHVLIPG